MPGARIRQGDRVTLRTVEREDLGFIQRASANPEVRYPLGSPLRSRTELEDGYADGGSDDDSDRFLVCVDDEAGPGQPETDAVRRIGVVSVEDAEWRRPELGYWLVPEVHGEGYGKAAVSLVVDYVFRTYDHPAAGAIAYEFNDASRGLLESLGFEEEGRTHADRFIDGAYVDTISYVLFRDEWRERVDG